MAGPIQTDATWDPALTKKPRKKDTTPRVRQNDVSSSSWMIQLIQMVFTPEAPKVNEDLIRDEI